MLQKRKNPSRYPSRFGVIPHDFLTTLYQILHIIVESIAMASEKGCIRERLRFHGMKHFVSYHETVRSKRRNTLFHPVKQADTFQSCFRRVQSCFRHRQEFCFTRNRIQLLRKRLRVYTIAVFSFVRIFAP